MKSSDLLVKCLKSEGVDRIFGIPGEENLDLMDSLIGSGIRFVVTRQESSAAYMAGMVGRLTGRPGACLTTLGPGAANMVIGVSEAFLGYCPMVAMSGQLPAECQRGPRKQYLDLMTLFQTVTKGCMSLRSGVDVPAMTRRAFSLAAEERPGPVFLELPQDVMGREADGAPLLTVPRDVLSAGEQEMTMVRYLLATAQRPIVLAGAGVVRGRCGDVLIRFAESWGVPVATTWLGAGVVPFDHPLSVGTVGLRKADLMRAAFEQADAVVLVGFDMMEFEPQYWNIGAVKKVAYVGAAACDRVPGHAPEVEAVGDLAASLNALTGPGAKGPAWTTDLKAQLVGMIDTVPDEAEGIKPQAIVRAIRNALGRDDIAVSDVGAHLIWMAQRYPVYKENTLLMSNGLIPMGVGVPWAIAAKLTFPDRKVVASVGDGSFAMTGMDLMTAKEHDVPFVTVVWNDHEYRLIRAKQEAGFGRSIGVEFQNPDYEHLARSMGIRSYVAGTAAELEDALAQGLRDEEVVLIDAHVDRSEALRFG